MRKPSLKIAVIGTGYVGLVTGACLAELGHAVTCVDVDPDKIARLSRGEATIFEPGLDRCLADGLSSGRLDFTTETAPAVAGADLVFIAVGTPPGADGHADLSQVTAAAVEIADALTEFTVVVTKSTVPVGTGDSVEALIRARRPDAEVAVASNPEFLREGAALADCRAPDRIVLGAEDARAHALLKQVYDPLIRQGAAVLFTSRRSAELIKYAANGFLAVKIAFINEIADLCQALDADVEAVAAGMGMDARIGPGCLRPGPGYGGSCFPKDTLALASSAAAAHRPLRIVQAAMQANDARKDALVERVAAGLGPLRGRVIALLGLTFKAHTDDLRESPAMALARGLVEAGAAVRAHDPQGMAEAERLIPELEMCTDPHAAAWGADGLVIATEWPQFGKLDLGRLKRAMRGSTIVDLRNLLDPAVVRDQGFIYVDLGRGSGGTVAETAPPVRAEGQRAP